jgi:DNA polymerase-3 subunit alpha
MLEVLDSALSYGQQQHADRLAGQGSIFDLDETPSAAPRHHPTIAEAEYEKAELLRLEKETLGVFVSEHPLHAVRELLRRKVESPLGELERRRDGEMLTVGGIVSAIKSLTTKKGEPMVFLRLDDFTGSAEVVVFNSVYAASRELLETDRILVIKGRVDHKQEGETKLIAMEVGAFEAVEAPTRITLRIDARKARAGIVRDLSHIVGDFPGEARVVLSLQTSEGPKVLELGDGYRVSPVPDFYAEVKALLGEAAVG